MSKRDWRLPEHRREAFQRFYSFHLRYASHPGLVYSSLPHIAEALEMDEDQRAWLVWLNGNTQNPATSLLLLEAAPTHHDWQSAVAFWEENYRALEWDTDRRHQKSKFGEATAKWAGDLSNGSPSEGWLEAGLLGWDATWKYATSQPFMGRLSSWSMIEYARILFGDDIPDAGTWMLDDVSGSKSHRNGLALVGGYDSVYWDADVPKLLGIVDDLRLLGDELLEEARRRNPKHPDVGRLTMESALCTYKSWHKPGRRYPNVYADMAYNRIRKAEARFGNRFELLWEARTLWLPPWLRLEDSPYDPGLSKVKQNHYLETGEPIMMDHEYPDMKNEFNDAVELRLYGTRKDPSWKL